MNTPAPTRIAINLKTPDADDVNLAGLRVAEAWLDLQAAMVGTLRNAGPARIAASRRLAALLEVQAHVTARVLPGAAECPPACASCARVGRMPGADPTPAPAPPVSVPAPLRLAPLPPIAPLRMADAPPAPAEPTMPQAPPDPARPQLHSANEDNAG